MLLRDHLKLGGADLPDVLGTVMIDRERCGRSIVVTHEDPTVSAFRARQKSPRTRALLRDRGRVAELANAWLKEKLGLRRFHVRGLKKVASETLWAVLTYNIQQWIRLRWRPRLGIWRRLTPNLAATPALEIRCSNRRLIKPQNDG